MSMLVADTDFTCGTHSVVIYWAGLGNGVVGELTPLLAVRWQRIRDDISTAECAIATHACCELLGTLRTIAMEMHIFRDDKEVWCGPITRIEYEWNVCRIFAEDMLWVAKRRVLEVGYNQAYPNIGNVIDRMTWLMGDQCYRPWNDPWNMLPHLHPMHQVSAPEPKTSRIVAAYQVTVWEDFDKYAEDMGVDYCVVGRDIYWFDVNFAWAIIPPLDENWISQFPRVVEYGNQLANRAFVTNGRGWAGQYTNPDPASFVPFGGAVDILITNEEGDEEDDPPRPEELAEWAETAKHAVDGKAPSPLSVLIPANTTLMPATPWTVDMLIPGAWFQATVTRLCRTVSEWQRLNEIVVTESAPQGEVVQFTAISAPSTMVLS